RRRTTPTRSPACPRRRSRTRVAPRSRRRSTRRRSIISISSRAATARISSPPPAPSTTRRWRAISGKGDSALTGRPHSRSPARTRSMWALLLVLGGLGVGLVLAEGAARVVEHFWCLTQYQGAARRSRTLGWGHQPGARGWFQSCPGGALEWRTYSRFDQGGLRSDRDVPRARSDAVRVLVIGDSFTEGLQVPLDQTWVHLAERRLNATAPPGVRYELLNAGMSAWGTDNELLWYLHEGRYYRPDVVLLAFNTSNDVFENDRALVSTNFSWPDKPYFALEQNRLVLRGYPLEPEPRRRVVVRAAICWLVLRSALMRRLADIDYFKNRLILSGPPGGPTTNVAQPVEGYLRDPPPHWSEAWRITRGLVLRLRSEVEARGSRFVVVVLNGKAEVAPAMWPWLARHGPYKD